MDLNLFYSQHQIALMKAQATTSATERDRHLDKASSIARRIGSFQLAQGAAAGVAWRKTAMIAEGVAL
jgi:glycyl-tRNA synthetase alpha subunit